MFFEFSGFLSPTDIHIVFGLIGFVFLYLVLRKFKYAAIIAWVIIFGLQVANECIDIYYSLQRFGDIHVRNTIKDFVATLLLPGVAVLFLTPQTARFFKGQKREDIKRSRRKKRRSK